MLVVGGVKVLVREVCAGFGEPGGDGCGRRLRVVVGLRPIGVAVGSAWGKDDVWPAALATKPGLRGSIGAMTQVSWLHAFGLGLFNVGRRVCILDFIGMACVWCMAGGQERRVNRAGGMIEVSMWPSR